MKWFLVAVIAIVLPVFVLDSLGMKMPMLVVLIFGFGVGVIVSGARNADREPSY